MSALGVYGMSAQRLKVRSRIAVSQTKPRAPATTNAPLLRRASGGSMSERLAASQAEASEAIAKRCARSTAFRIGM